MNVHTILFRTEHLKRLLCKQKIRVAFFSDYLILTKILKSVNKPFLTYLRSQTMVFMNEAGMRSISDAEFP